MPGTPELSPTLSVDVPQFEGPDATVEYGYFLGWGQDPDENGWLEQWTAGVGLEIQATLYCRWEDRVNLIRALRGQIRLVDNGNGNSVERIPPSFRLEDPYPTDGMSYERMVCTGFGQFQRLQTRVAQADDEGGGGTPGGLYSTFVILPCNFEQAPYQIEDNAYDRGDPSGRWYTTSRFEDAGQVINPPGVYKFKGTDVLVQDSQIGIYTPASEITVERIFMPQLPMQDIAALKGRVNSDTITFNGIDFPPGCLLMTGVSQTDVYGDPGSGKLAFDYQYRMLAKMPSNAQPGGTNAPLSWNFIMNTEGVYAEVVDKNGKNPFATADFGSVIWIDKPA